MSILSCMEEGNKPFLYASLRGRWCKRSDAAGRGFEPLYPRWV
jgi:hypothetical protein